MWTEAHRARHDARLKEIVSLHAVAQVARWLERADPPRSGRATPYAAVVRAIAWHLRIGGPWRALPPGGPHWRTVYGWFRKWLEQGLFDRLLADVARRRRRAMGRRASASPEHHRHAVRQVHSGARAPWVRRRQEGTRAQARGLG